MGMMVRSSLVAVGLMLTVAHWSAFGDSRADDLVRQVIESRTTMLRVRTTLTRTEMATGEKDVRQLRITARFNQAKATVLFEQTWPNVQGVKALALSDSGDHQLKGFRFEAGKLMPFTPRASSERFFDSDLTVEDVADGFWFWPVHSYTMQESVGEYACDIVEFRRPPHQALPSLVKAWVSPSLKLALRLEQYRPDGQLMKRITLHQILKEQNIRIPSIVTVEPSDGRSRTVLQGIDYDARLNLKAKDFTLSAIEQSLRTARPAGAQ